MRSSQTLFLSLISWLIFSFALYPQEAGIYTLHLKDKKGTPYRVDRPQDFLSAAALARRAREGVAVTYDDLPVSPAYLDTLRRAGLTIRCTSRWFNTVTVTIDDPALLDTIRTFRFVDGLRLVRPFGSKSSSTPHKFDKEQIISNVMEGLPQLTMVRGDELHALGYRGRGVLVALLDAGFYHADRLPAFDSLRDDDRIAGTRDMVSGNTTVWDDHPHGMYVLSILAGLYDRLTGSAPEASYLLIRTEDASSEYPVEEEYWLAGAELADSAGAEIISSSLGYFTFDDPRFDHIYRDLDGHTTVAARAALEAARRGIIVVASAGNEGNDTWHYILTPADADSILAVGAVNVNGLPTAFTSYGPAADGRVKPDVAALGEEVTIQNTQGGLSTGAGTSFSAPIVAGMMACLRQAFPSLPSQALIAALRYHASQYDHPDDRLGYGIPDAIGTYHELLLMSRLHHAAGKLLVRPNPSRGQVIISFLTEHEAPATLLITDLAGKRIMEIPFTAHPGYNSRQLNLDGLAAGTYILHLSSADECRTTRLIKTD